MKIEMLANQLTETEVRERLEMCSANQNVTDELYSFGLLLVKQSVDDVQRVDAKATSLAAYCGVIVAFLFSAEAAWSKVHALSVYALVSLAGLMAVIAATFAVFVLRLHEHEWFSQSEWLQKSCLNDLIMLKQYRILTMWGVVKSHRDVHSKKVNHLLMAQFFLGAAAVFLFAAFVSGLWLFNFNHGFWLTGR
jgi:hypothetical protein